MSKTEDVETQLRGAEPYTKAKIHRTKVNSFKKVTNK